MKASTANSRGFQTLARLKALAVWWGTPRSTDRDEAFREGFLRSATATIFVLATLSFLVSVVVFQDEWHPLSFPTLHVFALVSCALVGFSIQKKRLAVAGWLILLLVLIGASSVVLLSRQNGSVAGIFLGPPAYSMVPIVAALVLPQGRVLLVGLASIAAYALAQFAIPVSDFAIEGLNAEFMIVPLTLVLLFEGILLRQLRTEFDARLAEMQRSVIETERAKQQAEAARQRAEEADTAKSQFLANVSHELRTPLNAIIGYDEAMLAGMAGEFTPKQIKLLGIIQHSSRRLLTLINDILDLSKIESGSLVVHRTSLDPARIIRETIDSLCGLAEEKEIYLDVSLTKTMPEAIYSDKSKLEQIITNLLSNAIKFTEKGGVTITVRGTADGTLIVDIADTGIGIPLDAQISIFDPFRQVDGTLKRKYQGTGLGLSITKRLVEALGGSIAVKSAVGVGSTFTVTLPASPDSPQNTNSAEHPKQSQ